MSGFTVSFGGVNDDTRAVIERKREEQRAERAELAATRQVADEGRVVDWIVTVRDKLRQVNDLRNELRACLKEIRENSTEVDGSDDFVLNMNVIQFSELVVRHQQNAQHYCFPTLLVETTQEDIEGQERLSLD